MRKMGEIMIPGAGHFTIMEEMKTEGLFRRFFIVRYEWNELTEHGIRKRSKTIDKFQILPDALKCILSLMNVQSLNNLTTNSK